MQKQKLPKSIKKEADEYARLSQEAKDASNTANRQKTKLRNSIKEHWTKEGLPIGSFVRAGGLEIRYEATLTNKISADDVMKLYEAGEITREQFLRMVSIQVGEAKNVLGGDQVAEFTEEVVGKNLDIRLEALPVEHDDDEFVFENRATKTRTKRRKVFGNKNKVSQTATSTKVVTRRKSRRIKSRVSKK